MNIGHESDARFYNFNSFVKIIGNTCLIRLTERRKGVIISNDFEHNMCLGWSLSAITVSPQTLLIKRRGQKHHQIKVIWTINVFNWIASSGIGIWASCDFFNLAACGSVPTSCIINIPDLIKIMCIRSSESIGIILIETRIGSINKFNGLWFISDIIAIGCLELDFPEIYKRSEVLITSEAGF